jgi:hypothetical protein
MSDQPTPDRFKAEMPQIPGVSGAGSRRSHTAVPLAVIGGLAAVLIIVFLVGRWLLRPHPTEIAAPEPAPQLEVPTPPPDPAAALPHSTAQNPQIGTVDQFVKPWSSQEFIFRDRLNGENIPAIIIRLPVGGASQASGYWALSLKAPYGSCKLEYVTDLEKLRNDYDFRGARHPMVGNPCTRTLFDPLRMANMPGNVWVRGAMVQGSDLRPPLGIELSIEKGQILALRME